MGQMDIHAFRMVFGSKLRGYPVDEVHDSQLTADGDIEVLKTLSAFFKPKVMVEIGVFEGQTSKALLESSPWIQKYIGVDMFQDRLPKEYFVQFEGVKNRATGEAMQPVSQPGYKAKDDARFDIILLGKPDGLKPEMIALADMVFIDGDHGYEAVKRDTEAARAALKGRKGVLVWHDYLCTPGVKRFIDEYNTGDGGDSICLVVGTNMCFEIV